MNVASRRRSWRGLAGGLLVGIVSASLPIAAAPPADRGGVAVDEAALEAHAELDAATQQYFADLAASLAQRVDAEGELARLMLTRIATARPSQSSDAPGAGAPQRVAALALARRLADDAAAAPELLAVLLGTGVMAPGSSEWHELVAAAQRRQPGNLAIAVWQLGVGVPLDDEAGIDAWFASTAHMDRFDSDWLAVVRLLSDVTRNLPMPPLLHDALTRTVELDAADAAFADLVLPIGVAASQAMPAVQHLTTLCDPARASYWTTMRGTHCLRIAQTVAMTADTDFGESIGLTMWGRLTEGDAAPGVTERQRARQWRQAAHELGEAVLARAWLQAVERGLSQRDVFSLALQDAGISLTPPAEWQPTSD
jgi:hypothetical protein